MPLLLVRHARAGDRAEWEGDDRQRPLDDRGAAQAARLVQLLARFPIDAILTSPYLRCVQTVEPLAAARGLRPDVRPELGEGLQAAAGVSLVRSLAGRPVVICGHAGLELALPDPPRWRKGSVLVLGPSLDVVETIRTGKPELPTGPSPPG